MRKLIASKALRYDTRRLIAGDEFEATDMHARILVGIRKAEYAPAHSLDKAAPVKHVERAEAMAQASVANPEWQERPGDLDRLRVEAHRLGIVVDGRWGTIRLKQEIMQAKYR